MMESANGISQGSDTNVSQPGSSSAVAPASSTPAASVDERTFRQSEVNDIVKKVKHEAVEGYKRLQSEQPSYIQQKEAGRVEQPYQAPQSPNANVSSEHEVRRLASEEVQRARDQWMQEARTKSQEDEAKRTVQDFWNKTAPGKEKYQDFDKVTGDIEYARFPNVVQLLAKHVENSHDVLYELGKDRTKMATLETLAAMSPRDAIIQAQRLAQSIKDNEAAKQVRVPNQPLSQLRPSNTGTDNGVMSVKDYRAKYKV